jgi:hypothetical protein
MWCHQEIPKLKSLNLIPMVIEKGKLIHNGDEEPMPISIRSMTQQLYSNKDTLKSTTYLMKYYIPSEKKNATFNAFC